MPYLITIALVAFVIILAGGLLMWLENYLPASKGVHKALQILIACATLAALILFVLIPLMREVRS